MLRTACLALVTSLALLVGCGGGNAASEIVSAPAYQPKDQTKCSVEKSQAKPLIVEWPSADRGELEAQAHTRGLVVVRYQGCELQVLDRCSVPVKYGYVPITRKKDRVEMRDADDLYANIPVGAARFEAKLDKSGELDVDMTLVGRWEADRTSVRLDELQGDCTGATHVISALTTGAFTFTAGADASVGGGANVMSAGAGAQSSSKRETLTADGDETACEKSTTDDKAPPQECGALIRIEVVPLGESKQVDTTPTCPVGSQWNGQACAANAVACPTGSSWNGSACAGNAPPPPAPLPQAVAPPANLHLSVPSDAPSIGPANAPVVIQAFLDLQCPFCSKAMTPGAQDGDNLAKVLASHPNDVRLVFRQLPLAFHVLAEPAAEVALEARAEHGNAGFWRVAMAIFKFNVDNPGKLDVPTLEAIASTEHLDLGRVRQAMAAHAYKARIDADVAFTGNGTPIVGTPTFVIGDELVLGSQKAAKFEEAIARQRAKLGLR